MNKQELIERVAQKENISKAKVKIIYEALLEETIAELKKGHEVIVPSFGRFELKEKASREVIVPKSDVHVDVPAHNTVVFRASKVLKKVVK